MPSIVSIKVDHLIGTQVGTSTILKELARGGMAIVFIAYQRTLKRQIAVKILPRVLLTPASAELFQQEAEAAAILSHPNIIPVYEIGESDEFLFFTMQLVQGKSLSDYLKTAKKNIVPSKRILPLKTTLQLIIQILDALDYAHNQDIVHRDIKPGNILIETHTQRPIVSDFGIAKILRDKDDNRPAVQGTPLYMSPEQVLGPSIDGRADVYAVGTMLFQMVVPRLPLPQYPSKRQLIKDKLVKKNGWFLKAPSEINPQLHEDMDRIIQKATAYDRQQRYATCREFITGLERYQKNHMP